MHTFKRTCSEELLLGPSGRRQRDVLVQEGLKHCEIPLEVVHSHQVRAGNRNYHHTHFQAFSNITERLRNTCRAVTGCRAVGSGANRAA